MLSPLLVLVGSLPAWGLAAHAGEHPLYGGRTLSQWRVLIQETDFETLGQPEFTDGLLSIVADPQAPWTSRRQAALTLGRLGQPAARGVPLFIELLRSDGGAEARAPDRQAAEPDPEATMLWTLRALALMETSAAAAAPDVARIILDHRQPLLVRINALETLGRIGRHHERALPTFVEILRTERTPEQGSGMPPPGLSSPESSPASHPKELRMAAAEGLSLLESSAAPALPELIRATRDRWPLLRRAAAKSIGAIGPAAEIAIPTLVDLVLFDEAGEVREAAADALGDVGVSALPALGQLILDEDQGVRRLAIRGLSQPGSGNGAAPVLETAFRDHSPLVRVEAAASLLEWRRKQDSTLARPDDERALDVLLDGLLPSNGRPARITAYRALQTHVDRLVPYRDRLSQLADDPALDVRTARAARQLLVQMKADQNASDSETPNR